MGQLKPADLVVMGLLLLMTLAPLAAATVVSYRSHRRGWWLAAPWLLLVGLTLIVLQGLYSLAMMGTARTPLTFIAVSGLIAAWLDLSVFLIALTVAGPKLAPPGLARRS